MNLFTRPASHYVFAILIATAAIFLRWLIDPYVQDRVPFAFLMLGLVIVSTRCGFGPGIVTLVLGCLATMWLFLTPRHTLNVTGVAQQISLVVTVLLGVMIAVVGESLLRAKKRARAYEDLLSDDFQHTGEVFVSTLGGFRPLHGEPPFSRSHAESGSVPLAGPIGRIISEAIPRIPETMNAPNWQVLANGVPVVNVEVVRDGLRDQLGGTRKWVVTHFNPNATKLASRDFRTVVREFSDRDCV